MEGMPEKDLGTTKEEITAEREEILSPESEQTVSPEDARRAEMIGRESGRVDGAMKRFGRVGKAIASGLIFLSAMAAMAPAAEAGDSKKFDWNKTIEDVLEHSKDVQKEEQKTERERERRRKAEQREQEKTQRGVIKETGETDRRAMKHQEEMAETRARIEQEQLETEGRLKREQTEVEGRVKIERIRQHAAIEIKKTDFQAKEIELKMKLLETQSETERVKIKADLEIVKEALATVQELERGLNIELNAGGEKKSVGITLEKREEKPAPAQVGVGEKVNTGTEKSPDKVPDAVKTPGETPDKTPDTDKKSDENSRNSIKGGGSLGSFTSFKRG